VEPEEEIPGIEMPVAEEVVEAVVQHYALLPTTIKISLSNNKEIRPNLMSIRPDV
jgi:hypothetical protein